MTEVVRENGNTAFGAVVNLNKAAGALDDNYGFGASMGRAMARGIAGIVERGDEDSELAAMDDDRSFYSALPAYLKPIQACAAELGLRLITDVDLVGDVTQTFTANSAKINFEVADTGKFETKIKELTDAIASAEGDEKTKMAKELTTLMYKLEANIAYTPSGKDLNSSRTLQALINVGPLVQDYSEFVKFNRDMWAGIFEELDEGQREIALNLFLYFNAHIDSRIGVIGTGDAGLGYVKNTDEIMTAWLSSTSALYMSPSFMAYKEQVKSLYLSKLRDYLTAHEAWSAAADGKDAIHNQSEAHALVKMRIAELEGGIN